MHAKPTAEFRLIKTQQNIKPQWWCVEHQCCVILQTLVSIQFHKSAGAVLLIPILSVSVCIV